jgi:hypothetical protein
MYGAGTYMKGAARPPYIAVQTAQCLHRIQQTSYQGFNSLPPKREVCLIHLIEQDTYSVHTTLCVAKKERKKEEEKKRRAA